MTDSATVTEVNTITCPAGKSVLGGGVRTETEDFEVVESGPFDSLLELGAQPDDGWRIQVLNTGAVPADATVWAICATVTSIS